MPLRETILEALPVCLAQIVHRTENGKDESRAQLHYCHCPGRIDALDQRQRFASLDPGDRKSGKRGRIRLNFNRTEPGVERGVRIKPNSRTGIKCDQPAAGEVIVDLGRDTVKQHSRLRRLLAKGTKRLIGALIVPVAIGRRLGEKTINCRLRNTWFAAAVADGAQGGNDVGDHGGKLWRRGGIGRHDTVAVEG